jgi:hypothetical protein
MSEEPDVENIDRIVRNMLRDGIAYPEILQTVMDTGLPEKESEMLVATQLSNIAPSLPIQPSPDRKTTPIDYSSHPVHRILNKDQEKFGINDSLSGLEHSTGFGGIAVGIGACAIAGLIVFNMPPEEWVWTAAKVSPLVVFGLYKVIDSL